jgi:hypothetical protein
MAQVASCGLLMQSVGPNSHYISLTLKKYILHTSANYLVRSPGRGGHGNVSHSGRYGWAELGLVAPSCAVKQPGTF